MWSAWTVLSADHTVVDGGPYQHVRHPIYAFACLQSIGTVMVFPTWWNVVAGILMVALYVTKALREERVLLSLLPGYRAYQQRVRYRIAPWIW